MPLFKRKMATILTLYKLIKEMNIPLENLKVFAKMNDLETNNSRV